MDYNKPIEIGKNIFWIGYYNQTLNLQCNPYLLIDKEEGVLIDPGNALDYKYVFEKTQQLIDPKKIRYIILHHQDPDLCSSTTLFEGQLSDSLHVVCHWRTKELIRFYGIKSPYYTVNEKNYQLVLNSGRVLKFIPSPYLHFPGAIMTYDEKSKILFSSDLFGGFSEQWSLYAGENYFERMLSFHEHYMPGNDFLRPVMDILQYYPISLIAPQHGSIIKKDIPKYINSLANLECGILQESNFLNRDKKTNIIDLMNQILKRLYSYSSKEKILTIFKKMDVTLDKSGFIVSHKYKDLILWNSFFELILEKLGITYLSYIEPMVSKIVIKNNIPYPRIFNSEIYSIKKELINAMKKNKQLKNNLKKTENLLTKCPITNLYNEIFFRNFIINFLRESRNILEESFILIISIDQFDQLIQNYSQTVFNEQLKIFASFLIENKPKDYKVFRLSNSFFAYIIPYSSKEESILFFDKLKNNFTETNDLSNIFRFSGALINLNTMDQNILSIQELPEKLLNLSVQMIREAKRQGGNILISNSGSISDSFDKKTILIIEPEPFQKEILQFKFNENNFNTITSDNGFDSLHIIGNSSINLICSNYFINNIDALALKIELNKQSKTKLIPFIVYSHLKNEEMIKKTYQNGISYFFHQPFSITELIETSRMLVNKDAE